jgi:hypothetical protein
MNQATLEIPASCKLSAKRFTELPDNLAISYGRTFSAMLVESDGHVLVTLSDGTRKAFCYRTVQNLGVVG